jgi:plasmid stabilization system protein ParE
VKVVWTLRALDNLAAIERFIGRDSPDRAVTWVDELFERGERLREFPHVGQPPAEIPHGPYRQVWHGNYRLVFRLDEDTDEVVIVGVFEGHRPLRKTDVER